MDFVKCYLNLDESGPSVVQERNTGSTEPWADFYKDNGDTLLNTAQIYDNFQEFEKAYYIQFGNRPLHHAIKSNKVEIVRKILLKGADANVVDFLSFSPLYYAILIDDIEIVKLLLNYGATAKGSFLENEQEITYFQRVCQSSHWEIVKLFLKHGCNANDLFVNDHWNCPMYSRPLHVAVMHTKLETMYVLLNHNANVNDVDARGRTPLYLACMENFLEAVELLLNKNALVNVYAEDCSTPLYHGLRHKNYKIIQLLLANGALIDNSQMICGTMSNHPLHEVICLGYLDIMENLLSHGLDVDMKCAPIDSSLLQIAVDSEQIEIVYLLLRYNAKVHIKDYLEKTPLHYAAKHENEVIMELLLQHNSDLKDSPENDLINMVDKEGLNPFHVACEGTNIQCIQYLLDCGADINAEDFNGFTPLHIACKIGNYEVVDFLIRNKALVNINSENNLSPLHIAVKSGHEKIIELLLMNEAVTISQNKDKEIPLEIAIRNLHLKAIELLLQYNPDVNNDHYKNAFLKVLSLYKTMGYKIIECFLKYGFTIKLDDKYNDFMLLNIIKNGYYKVFEQLLNTGIDVNTVIDGETLLHIATKNGHYDLVQLLISNKANVFAKNKNGEIPIFYAVKNNDKYLVETFVKNGVDLKQYPDLLHYAVIKCGNKCVDIVELLLEHGADIDYRDDRGSNVVLLLIETISMLYSTTQHASPNSHAKTLEFLLKKGANVNAQNKDGQSVLQIAMQMYGESNELIKILLEYDVDVNCSFEFQNGEGTPLHLCCAAGNDELVTELLNHGADINAKNKAGLTALQLSCNLRNDYWRNKILMPLSHLEIVCSFMNDCFIMNIKIEERLYRHIYKLEAAGLYVSPENLDCIQKGEANYRSKCKREIEMMKELRINRYVSMYDVLVKDLAEVDRYARNENVRYINYWIFPEYKELIINKLKRADRRHSTLMKAMQALNFISGRGLPYACSEKIIAYLSFEDLRSIADLVP